MPSTVEAVIVAGGSGTRLLPLTTNRPKHLLEVAGAPFVVHQIARLADAGVEHVVLATSYHADLFEPVLGDGSTWGVRLSYVREPVPLGTAGAIRNAGSVLTGDPDGAVVILNGDILSAHDLAGQLADFETPREGRPVDVSLHLVEVDDARAFGCVPTDEAGRVVGFMEKSETPVTRQVNAGCYVFRRRIVDEIPSGRVVSVERETFPELIERRRIVTGFVDPAYWRDVGTPASLVAASRDLVLGVAPGSWTEAEPSAAHCDPSSDVDATSTVNGGSALSAGVRVASGALVAGSVVMPGAVIGSGAVVVDSVVGPGAEVGPRAQLRDATIGDGARIGPGVGLPAGERVDCGAEVTLRGR